MLSQFLGTAYGLSTSNLPLIVVDLVGLLCVELTLAVTLYLRGSLIRSAKWNSRNTTSISQTPQPEESDGGRPPRSAPGQDSNASASPSQSASVRLPTE